MKVFIDLFSGIGGFAYAAYLAGLRFDEHYFSEIDEKAIRIYKSHFPESVALGDCKKIDYSQFKGSDLFITGGFPCQPFSIAGLRKGEFDDRNLWPVCVRALREGRPKIALFENVPGIFIHARGRPFFDQVLCDLSEAGYDAEWYNISACGVGAIQRRARIWILAYPGSDNKSGISFTYRKIRRDITETEMQWRQFYKAPYRNNTIRNWQVLENWLCGELYGISDYMDRYNLLANSIVPQCAELIMNQEIFDCFREPDN